MVHMLACATACGVSGEEACAGGVECFMPNIAGAPLTA
jgi:hypothetical protein